MGLFRGIGARKDAVRGTSPIEVRKVLAGLFASTGGISARPGILPGGTTPLVTGNGTWAYNVGLFHAFVSYSAGDGGQVYGNDSAVLIGTTGVGSTVPIAPGSGLSRIDIIWTRHPTNTENTDTSSEPLFGVASGTAASTPTAPTIPTGALEIGRNTMTSAATSTLSAGNTITQSALYTGLRGTPVWFRNQAERDAFPSPYNGLQGYRLDLHRGEFYDGTAWRFLGVASVANQVARDALTLFDGLQVYRLDTHVTETYDGTGWLLPAPVTTWTTSGDVYCPVTASVVNALVTLPAVGHNTRVFIHVAGIAGYSSTASFVGINIVGSNAVTVGYDSPLSSAGGVWIALTRSGWMDIPANTTATIGTTSWQSVVNCHFSLSMTLTRVNI